jgi:hypothetical protein
MTEKEKMLSGKLYDPLDPQLSAERRRARLLFKALNDTRGDQQEERARLIRALIPASGQDIWIEPPFYCDYGSHITLGDRVFFNCNCVVLDVAPVRIGSGVLIGPAVQISAAAHLASGTADLVCQYGMVEHVTVTSFQQPRLAEIRAYASELPTGWLVSEVSDATITQARWLGLTQICPRANTVTPALVRRLHAEGFVVRTWGVADEALMRQVVEAGADGMTVNFPDKLLVYLKRSARQS